MGEVADAIAAMLPARFGAGARAPYVLGIAGAQGSGKSTVAAQLAERLAARGLRCALLSLDDLYLDGVRRAALAAQVHPLLRTRGVPGTHDVALGLAILERLGAAGPVALPRFDKARDEPVPRAQWPRFEAPADVLILEGWCLGARPQSPGMLAVPVNALEREADASGAWRGYVNDQLTGPYARLFDRIDGLALLAAPDFATVATWRIEQEHGLRARCAAEGRSTEAVMSDAEVRSFVAYFQRITEQMLLDASADRVIRLDRQRQILAISPAR
ncbi:D-glycerate 3-kinase [Sphingomonas naasensis]|nr:kinase [Sphingomonas naasensis]NIJ19386.1 D-glycerate 3-kinase [Sphingomonas naasensis]